MDRPAALAEPQKIELWELLPVGLTSCVVCNSTTVAQFYKAISETANLRLCERLIKEPDNSEYSFNQTMRNHHYNSPTVLSTSTALVFPAFIILSSLSRQAIKPQ